MKKDKGQGTEKGKAWLKREMRPYRPFILFLTALTVAGTLLSLAFAYLTRYLVNSASEKDGKRLILFAVILLSALLLRILVQTAVKYLSEKGRAKISVKLKNKLFFRTLRADYASFEKYHSGDLLNRFDSDVTEVAADSVNIFPAVAGMIVQCVGAVAALLTLDPLFTAIFVAGAAVVGILTALFRRKVMSYHREMTEAKGESRAFMQESLTSALTLKAYGTEEKSAEKSRGLLDIYYRKRMKRARFTAGMSGVFSLLGNAGFIFAVIWCGVGIMRGTTDYGSLLSIVLLLGQLQHPVSAFSSVMPLVYARAASAQRLCELEEIPPEPQGRSDIGPLYAELERFIVERITFDYGRERLFCGASAEIEKGSVVCITGGSGSGKSTLFKLLLNVYTPLSGGVYAALHGEKILLTAKERGLFAYVPQGNFLFSGTIRENLIFFSEEKDEALSERDGNTSEKNKGNSESCESAREKNKGISENGESAREKKGDVSEKKIREALKAACAEFVWELPEGLDTPLRERGGGLSEGQLQRLAVARALLSDRPVLLLDEATSALDGETERKLLENIKNTSGKTCLIVTHRPAALEIADRVLRIENGKIE